MRQIRANRVLAAVSRDSLYPQTPCNDGRVRERLLSPENPDEGLFTPDEWAEIGNALDLSERELAVTILLIKGVSRQAIAHYLRKADGSCISAQTVRVYIDRVFRKARVTDRLALALRLARVYLMLRSSGAPGGKVSGSKSAAAFCHTTV